MDNFVGQPEQYKPVLSLDFWFVKITIWETLPWWLVLMIIGGTLAALFMWLKCRK